ncbi:hypothetical protein RJT34_12077 [Clitoria ternatea]|uniref:Uncharacterized protein n=1 Tax=Clitoria ternatea TaxID=43366 RepID=A0AAN9JN80_CLITE
MLWRSLTTTCNRIVRRACRFGGSHSRRPFGIPSTARAFSCPKVEPMAIYVLDMEVEVQVCQLPLAPLPMERFLARRQWDHSQSFLHHIYHSFTYREIGDLTTMSTEAWDLLAAAYDAYHCCHPRTT